MDAPCHFLYPLADTLETGVRLLGDFVEAASELYGSGIRFAFVGTPPFAGRVAKLVFLRGSSMGVNRPNRFWPISKSGACKT